MLAAHRGQYTHQNLRKGLNGSSLEWNDYKRSLDEVQARHA